MSRKPQATRTGWPMKFATALSAAVLIMTGAVASAPVATAAADKVSVSFNSDGTSVTISNIISEILVDCKVYKDRIDAPLTLGSVAVMAPDYSGTFDTANPSSDAIVVYVQCLPEGGGNRVTVGSGEYTPPALKTADSPASPVQTSVYGPNNDTVTKQITVGVVYTCSAWVNGTMTCTAAAAEGYKLPAGATTEFVFTDENTSAPIDPTGTSNYNVTGLTLTVFAPTGLVPEGASWVYMIDGEEITAEEPRGLIPGEHTLTLWVEGLLIASDTFTVSDLVYNIADLGVEKLGFGAVKLTNNNDFVVVVESSDNAEDTVTLNPGESFTLYSNEVTIPIIILAPDGTSRRQVIEFNQDVSVLVPYGPKANQAKFWVSWFGAEGLVCTKIESPATPYVVPAAPSGRTWYSAVVKAGSGEGSNQVYKGVSAGDVLTHKSGKGISHVFLCSLPMEVPVDSGDNTAGPKVEVKVKPKHTASAEDLIAPGVRLLAHDGNDVMGLGNAPRTGDDDAAPWGALPLLAFPLLLMFRKVRW